MNTDNVAKFDWPTTAAVGALALTGVLCLVGLAVYLRVPNQMWDNGAPSRICWTVIIAVPVLMAPRLYLDTRRFLRFISKVSSSLFDSVSQKKFFRRGVPPEVSSGASGD